MAIQVKHNFVSPVADAGNPNEVGPNEWNELHSITMASGNIIGRITAGTGPAEEISIANFATITTVADASALTIPAMVNTVEVRSYSTADARGGARYKRVTAQPSHGGRFRSVDRFLPNGTTDATNGGWWEIAEEAVNQYMFGARDAFAANDTAAFQAMADYCGLTGAAILPAPGRHTVNSPIIWSPKQIPDWDYNFYKRGPTWTFDNNMIVRATAAINAIFQFGNHTYERMIRQGVVSGGTFDCNNLATRGIWATFVNHCIIEKVKVLNMPANGCGIQVGTTVANEFATLDLGNEGLVHDCFIQGALGITARSNTAGIRFVNNTDNHTRGNLICDILYGIEADSASGWDGKHIQNHFWNHQEAGPMTWGYDLYGDNMIVASQHDGPFGYCARFRGERNHVVGAKVNYGLNPADADLYAALWRLEGSGEVTVTNSGFKATASKRIAAEASLGSGVTAAAFRKDESNRYSNVNGLSPVNLGTSAKDRCAIAAGAISSQTSKFGTFSRATPGGRIQYTYTLNISATDFVYSVVCGRQGGTFPAIINHISQTSNSVTFEVQNVSNTTVDPDYIGIQVEAI